MLISLSLLMLAVGFASQTATSPTQLLLAVALGALLCVPVAARAARAGRSS